ncbi:hypothetical protein DYB32_002035 [Aphanomyces invadans]|uniref:Urease accessory protein UreD n=1 Tax=Aphanomyces invadans TaxID=157072 RepID=A0A418B484_9STRA|nr:hypothetical protein DYB32_002035 [Aphanomyces invadans]
MSSQGLTVRVEADGFIAVVPDPVTCFAGALYAQHQRFSLHPSASLVLVDWITSGRHARGESWSFASFESFNEIVYEDGGSNASVVVVSDRVRLTDEPCDPLASRMGGMTVFGTVVLLGPQLDEMIQSLLQDGRRKFLAPHQHPVPAGSPTSTRLNQNVRAAVSRLSPSHPLLSSFSGAIVRIASRTTESAADYMRALVEPLEGVVGVRFFHETR